MRLKTYFATGVDAAMLLARQELGPDAMLVHSKRTSGEAQSLGSYEVVFALSEGAQLPPPVAPEPAPSRPGAVPAGGGEFAAAEIAGLRAMMEQTLRLVRRSETILTSRRNLTGDLADLDAVLEDGGFSPEFRQRVQLNLPAEGSLRQRVALWFDRQAPAIGQLLGVPGFARKTVALVGPPGAGKTTTLVKLATQYGVAGRRPAQILSVDAERVGAAESLRVNAGVLGIGFQLLDTTHALSQALAEFAHKELILIDTPGYSTAYFADSNSLAGFLASRKEIDTHLVLPADLPSAALKAHVDRFRVFEPGKLLFTRLDEAQQWGPMLETAIDSLLPVSFFGNGQRIPEDLAVAAKAAILERLLPHWLDEDPDGLRTRRAAA